MTFFVASHLEFPLRKGETFYIWTAKYLFKDYENRKSSLLYTSETLKRYRCTGLHERNRVEARYEPFFDSFNATATYRTRIDEKKNDCFAGQINRQRFPTNEFHDQIWKANLNLESVRGMHRRKTQACFCDPLVWDLALFFFVTPSTSPKSG